MTDAMKRSITALVALAALVAFAAALSAALVFPQLTGRVVDEANLLDASQEASLIAKLKALEDKTTDQFVVVTLNSLQGTSIEDFGYQLGRHWGIGQKDKNNGVLLIVAPNERKVRIEVGYGLEGVLTDALSKVIIETAITPRFREGDMAGGIVAGADDVITALTGDAEAIANRSASRPDISNTLIPAIFFFLFFSVFIITIIMAIRQGGLSGGSWSSGSSSGSSWSSSGGGFSGGGGSFGGGGSSGSW